jgi:hypothetical protein
MVIRVMTPDQAEELRQEMERDGQDGSPNHIEQVDVMKAEQPSQQVTAVAPTAPFLNGPLPAREHLKDWLLGIGQRSGLVTLRRILKELTGTEIGRGPSRAEIVDRIVAVTRGDPERLRLLLN